MGPITHPHSMWQFSPSLAASIAFLVLFFLTTVAHLIQALVYRKWYCLVIVMSGILQTGTYAFRTASIQNPQSYNLYAAWFVLILVAPLLTNAFVYMVFGRIVWNFSENRKLCGIKANHFSLLFVFLDVVAFIVQVLGAAKAVTKDASQDVMYQGLHIYMGGVGIQLLFILIFSFLGGILFYSAWKAGLQTDRKDHFRICLTMLWVQGACLFLIALRIVFRLCEYSQGLDSTIPLHETYQYCLDSLPMLLALILLNLMHPDRIMCSYPIRKPPASKSVHIQPNALPKQEASSAPGTSQESDLY